MKIFGIELPWLKTPRTGCDGRLSPTPVTDEFVRAQYPHCDPLVLHGPVVECWACNQYPERQLERIHQRINFTGDRIPSRSTCPAEQCRSLKQINAWPGNRPAQEHCTG